MKRKLGSILLSIALITGLLASPAFAGGSEVWDGTVDVSWYDESETEFYLSTPAQLAGLAAIVNGSVDKNCPEIVGDSNLICNEVSSDTLPGGITADVHVGRIENSFAGKTVYLTEDMNMGGQTDTTNWMPIGGLFCADTEDKSTVLKSWFAGVLDGCGHRITNIYCNRHLDDWSYGQGIGLIGAIGVYEGQSAPSVSPAVRNLSVSGSISGNRMVGGIVGYMGALAGSIYIENCANHAMVYSTDSKGCGGIVGAAWSGSGAIVNCYNDGDITANVYETPTGGICGSDDGVDVYCCYNTGKVYGTNGRGRGIGGNDDGGNEYTVSDCYYLSGCDNDSSSNGWYRGTSASEISCTAMTDSDMRGENLATLLNVNGSAYVAVSDGYPILFWEQPGFTFQNNIISITQPSGGTVNASVAEAKTGTIIRLSYTEEAGFSFRGFLNNGILLTGNYLTLNGDADLSATFESKSAGVMNISSNDACTVTVFKNGSIMENGEMKEVTLWPVKNGDALYEGDVLTVEALWREGQYPADPNMVYIGQVTPDSNSAYVYSFGYYNENGTVKEDITQTNSHTVTSDIAGEGVSLRLSVTANTTEKMWSHVAETDWYSSSGDEYTISSAEQLAGLISLSMQGNNFAGKVFTLGCDISLENTDDTGGVRCWNGIGTQSSKFAGTFDGNGYRITDMHAYASGSNVALFRYTDNAVIKNLTVCGSAESPSGAAGIAAQASATEISGCSSFVTVNAINTTVGQAGGIAANISSGTSITGCYSYGTVTGYDKIGGIVGQITDSSSSVTDCFNYGNVAGNSNRGSSGGIGGIAGKLSGQMSFCANYGDISGGTNYMGGVAGMVNCSSKILAPVSGCYNTGAVVNSLSSGSSGGICGYLSYGTLTACHNIGEVSGGTYTGGIIGQDAKRSSATVSVCRWLETSCEQGCGSGSITKNDISSATVEQFAGKEIAGEINKALGSSKFVVENGAYPELQSAIGGVHTHSGGIADCVSQAVCSSCGLPYGEKDMSNHVGDTELRNASEAVWTTDGYTGDIYCLSCNELISEGSIIPVDKNAIVFTVYEKAGEGEATVKKQFTAADFDRMFADCSQGTLAYQYWSEVKGEYKENLAVATKYVTLEKLFESAGVSFNSGDSLSATTGNTVTYETIVERNRYYSASDSYTTVPAVVAYCHNAGQTGAETLASEAKIGTSIRLLYGISESEYGKVGGFRLVSGISGLTVIHPVLETDISGDCNGDGIIGIDDVATVIKLYRKPDSAGVTDVEKRRADINENGEVDIEDVTKAIQAYRKS